MIQRIQTIYLLAAAFIMGALFIKSFYLVGVNVGAGVQSVSPSFADGSFSIYDNPVLEGLTLLTSVLSLVCVFLFKNRKTQMLLTRIIILLIVLCIGWAGFDFYQQTQSVAGSGASFMPGVGTFLPLVGIVLLFLASANIKKDDKIVRSMDRLR